MKTSTNVFLFLSGACLFLASFQCKSRTSKVLATEILAKDFNVQTQDLAVLLPANSKEDVSRLLKLDDSPKSLGLSDGEQAANRGFSDAILDQKTFESRIGNSVVKSVFSAEQIDNVPEYKNWRIVGIRPVLCARPRTTAQEPNLVNPRNGPFKVTPPSDIFCFVTST